MGPFLLQQNICLGFSLSLGSKYGHQTASGRAEPWREEPCGKSEHSCHWSKVGKGEVEWQGLDPPPQKDVARHSRIGFFSWKCRLASWFPFVFLEGGGVVIPTALVYSLIKWTNRWFRLRLQVSVKPDMELEVGQNTLDASEIWRWHHWKHKHEIQLRK